MGPELVVGLYLQDVFGPEDKQRILFEAVFLEIEGSGVFTPRTHADDKGVDTAREPEGLHFRFAVGSDTFTHYPRAIFASGHRDQFVQGEVGYGHFLSCLVHFILEFGQM